MQPRRIGTHPTLRGSGAEPCSGTPCPPWPLVGCQARWLQRERGSHGYQISQVLWERSEAGFIGRPQEHPSWASRNEEVVGAEAGGVTELEAGRDLQAEGPSEVVAATVRGAECLEEKEAQRTGRMGRPGGRRPRMPHWLRARGIGTASSSLAHICKRPIPIRSHAQAPGRHAFLGTLFTRTWGHVS